MARSPDRKGREGKIKKMGEREGRRAKGIFPVKKESEGGEEEWLKVRELQYGFIKTNIKIIYTRLERNGRVLGYGFKTKIEI